MGLEAEESGQPPTLLAPEELVADLASGGHSGFSWRSGLQRSAGRKARARERHSSCGTLQLAWQPNIRLAS